MKSFSLPSLLICIFGVILFNAQGSEQFAVGASEEIDIAQEGERAVCEGSMGPTNKCVKVKSVCYCFVKAQQSWAKANDFCKANSMKLLSIETQKQQNDVSDILMPLVLGYPVSKQIGIWTSGSYNSGQKSFTWLSTQKPFTYVNWFYGEPNTGLSNQCVRIRIVPESLTDGKWATLDCNQWLPSICEDN
ncbi:macrophage mannose receptor 1-like [Daphnia pulex]|uniref:macrophage mannose receptor 1-like n=1 Tax=Daphnia pulex TaxID=6669 RepID=UPI001EE0CAEB|nr:macrophage mannose receptor 1-like [Daphnia pulex]